MNLDLCNEFDALAHRAEQALFGASPVEILRVGSEAQKSDHLLLAQILATSGGNVYLLWGKPQNETKWLPLYVGQRKQKEIKTRLRQHLFKVHSRTESKLKRVEEYVKNGGRIGISVILIKPDELRTSIEQRLIKNNINKQPGWLFWNRHS